MFRKILVIVGPQADSTRPAIARAVTLAQSAGAAIRLLDVVYDPHLEGYLGHSEVYASLRERLVAERRERLREWAAELQTEGLSCETKAEWAHPAHTAVAREAAASDIDLVVFAPNDAHGLSNDEWRVVSISPTPVLVVRDAAVRPYASVVAAVDPVRAHDKPAALDFKIVDLAKRLRDLSPARLEVVHCLPPLRSFIPDDVGALMEAEKGLKAQRTRELVELVGQAGVPEESAVLVEGKPADALTEISASPEATLLVLGTVQRGPVARFLVGSTAERVLRTEGGDVAVIRPALADDGASLVGDESATRHVERDPSELD